MNRLDQFMSARRAESYPEPRTVTHDVITAKQFGRVVKHIAAGSRVLDVGCGQGPALGLFQREGYIATGITTNKEDFESCKAQSYAVKEIDQNAMPTYWTERYDVAWARHVLEHSPIPYFTLTEFNRVLVNGGILYMEVPMPDTACRHETNPNHYSVLGWRAWANLITRAGFEILEAESIPVMTPAGEDEYFWAIGKKLNNEVSQ